MKFLLLTLVVLSASAATFAAPWLVPDDSATLEVHEWGTYLSCQGSDGKTLPGVHHEEEKLPNFVLTRGDSLLGARNGMDFHPVANSDTEVLQKMETPVLYFYSSSPDAVEVSVNVSFPLGVTTHVYPAATVNLPAIGEVNSTSGGFTSWDISVQPTGRSVPIPPVDESNIWAPSRRVDANYVVGAGGADRLIFYRGVGRFELGLRVTSDDHTLTAHNDADLTIPAAFILETDGLSGGRVVALGQVQAGHSVSTPLSADGRSLSGDWLSLSEYLTRASVLLENSLQAAGLYPLEARAMVDTWTRSYFQTPGIRVLYITPRQWVDDLLPLSMRPAPSALERVFVGRIETMLESEERLLLAAAQRSSAWPTIESRMGRFSEPWLRRLSVLAGRAGDSKTATRCLARAESLD